MVEAGQHCIGDLEAMSRSFKLTMGGRTYEVEVGDLSENPVTVMVDGWEHKVTIPESAPQPTPSQERSAPTRTRPVAPVAAQPPRPAPAASSDSALRAPMPGKIVRVNVSEGESVSQGDALVVLESMKMENTLSSAVDGVVKAVHVVADDSVQQGQTLMEFG